MKSSYYVALRVNGFSSDRTRFLVDVHDSQQTMLIPGEVLVGVVPSKLVREKFPFWIECNVRIKDKGPIEPVIPFEFYFNDSFSYDLEEALAKKIWNRTQTELFVVDREPLPSEEEQRAEDAAYREADLATGDGTDPADDPYWIDNTKGDR